MNKTNHFLNKFLILFLFVNIGSFSFAGEEKARKFVNTVAEKIMLAAKQGKSSDAKLKTAIQDIVVTNFDIPWMAKFALGPGYNKLSEQEKKEYTDAYISYLAFSYIPILGKYKDETFNISKVSISDDKRSYDVDVMILRGKGKTPLSLRYHIVTSENEELKARDMIVEGVSTILNQRSEFSNIKGIDALIAALKKNVQTPKSKKQD